MRQHYLIYFLFLFVKARNDFIKDFTTLHKRYNLILALQLYIKRSYTTLYPEKKKNRYVYSTTEIYK